MNGIANSRLRLWLEEAFQYVRDVSKVDVSSRGIYFGRRIALNHKFNIFFLLTIIDEGRHISRQITISPHSPEIQSKGEESTVSSIIVSH